LAEYKQFGDLSVHPSLVAFVEKDVLPGTSIGPSRFWAGLDAIVRGLSPKNAALLARRDALQREIDAWHVKHPAPFDAQEYDAFLHSIGYLTPDAAGSFELRTSGVDDEIATLAGPQLVCPADNARFLLNAANARWGSLFDALYGTNAVPSLPGDRGGGYDHVRGSAVRAEAYNLLDEIFPLAGCAWAEVTGLEVADGVLRATSTEDGAVELCEPAQFVGHATAADGAELSLLLKRHGLHVELLVRPGDASSPHNRMGLADVRLESALSTIVDLEDSACTVDAEDKVAAYSNWLGLMKRSLSAPLLKAGTLTERTLAPPRSWSAAADVARGHAGAAAGAELSLQGQALLLCRNVGMHMLTDAVLAGGKPVPEHFVDALVTTACGIHDVQRARDRLIAQRRGGVGVRPSPQAANSAGGSIYVVKPKMHGPEECAHAVALFGLVEKVLHLPHETVKLGLMDEERRTSLNLAACMRQMDGRLFFVNTGFLDRTADEIHTSMAAGAVLPKQGIRQAAWLDAYERGNVRAALLSGVVGRGQIGKGMWAEPDNMAAMLTTKGAQLEAGASTAWVPSPTAASLHALHYLRASVADVHRASLAELAVEGGGAGAALRARLLAPPLMGGGTLSAAEVQLELDNNAQGLLGYVARWVGQGVGCSKVADLHGVQLMEDRATLRISSQHIANWMAHGVVTERQVVETLRRVAVLVDEQNADDAAYRPMAPAFTSPEWRAALELVFRGRAAPNGYTEESLTRWRRARKAADAAEQAAEYSELRDDVESCRLDQALLREAGATTGTYGYNRSLLRTATQGAAPLAKQKQEELAAYRQGHSMGGASYYSGGV
jgi:malate synthase